MGQTAPISIKALALSVLATSKGVPSRLPVGIEGGTDRSGLIGACPSPKTERHCGKNLAPCGSPFCAGCYDVGDGRKIHPPKCGAEFLRWRAWLEGKGPRQ
jgi:hypothetical protein